MDNLSPRSLMMTRGTKSRRAALYGDIKQSNVCITSRDFSRFLGIFSFLKDMLEGEKTIKHSGNKNHNLGVGKRSKRQHICLNDVQRQDYDWNHRAQLPRVVTSTPPPPPQTKQQTCAHMRNHSRKNKKNQIKTNHDSMPPLPCCFCSSSLFFQWVGREGD